MNPKFSIVFPVLNQLDLFKAVFDTVQKNTDHIGQLVEFIIIDNGSDTPLASEDFPGAVIIRNETPTGVYPTFEQGFKIAKGEIVGFFHSDMIVWEPGWNLKVVGEFEKDPKLGMIGFIGSNEIDQAGGRGLGTTSNFMGWTLQGVHHFWKGSPASVHGKQSSGVSNAAVVDGCAMILRRTAWEEIGVREDFPLHHFYDRLISTQLLEKGWKINVLGIACDHVSGQTTAHEKKYHDVAEAYSRKNIAEPNWIKNGDGSINWDLTVYSDAERIWLTEYRDNKRIVPISV